MRTNIIFSVLCLALFLFTTVDTVAQKPVINKKLNTNQLKTLKLKNNPIKYVNREKKAPSTVKNQLNSLRRVGKQKNWTFNVGYTKAMDKSIRQLTGLKMPRNWRTAAKKQNEFAYKMIKLEKDMFRANKIKLFNNICYASKKAFNYRDAGKMTPVKSQGSCGSCWAFGAMSAYEASYKIRNGITLDMSEQDVVSCAGAGSCAGGWYDPVFDYMLTNGVANEATVPYQAVNGSCQNKTKPYRAVNWGFVTVKDDIPNVQQLKNALCEHGPLAVCVKVTNAFRSYTSGVFNENDNGWINHVVTLVGWDDEKQAWLIKNSWGTWWGDDGYMWIRYGANSIGYAAAWVKAPVFKLKAYKVTPQMLSLIKQYNKTATVKPFVNTSNLKVNPKLKLKNNNLKLKRNNR